MVSGGSQQIQQPSEQQLVATQTVDSKVVKAISSRTTRASTFSKDSSTALLIFDTLPDLAINVMEQQGEFVYTVRVEPEETLGHFAEWLGTGRTGALRKLNRIKNSHTLSAGSRLLLPVVDIEMIKRFEQRRSEYHQVLNESIKEHYTFAGVEVYTIRKGDSLWLLSHELEVPLWVLYRFNPNFHNTPLKPGQLIKLPKLEAKQDSDTDSLPS